MPAVPAPDRNIAILAVRQAGVLSAGENAGSEARSTNRQDACVT
jgi:hypothetical protein